MVLNGMDMVWCLGKVKEGKNWKKLKFDVGQQTEFIIFF